MVRKTHEANPREYAVTGDKKRNAATAARVAAAYAAADRRRRILQATQKPQEKVSNEKHQELAAAVYLLCQQLEIFMDRVSRIAGLDLATPDEPFDSDGFEKDRIAEIGKGEPV